MTQMRPAKLKQRLQSVHPQSKDKDKSYFERKNKALKMMRLDASSEFCRRNSKMLLETLSEILRNTFSVEKLSDECQNNFLDLVNDSSARQAYHEKLLTQFWIKMKDSYLKTTEKALCILFHWLIELK